MASVKSWAFVATVKQLETIDYLGRETAARKALCQEGRQAEAAQLGLAPLAERIAVASRVALTKGGAYLGVLGEDDYGCYFGLIVRSGDPQAPLALGVFASTYLNGRTVDLYAYFKEVSLPRLQRMLDEQKALAKANVKLNEGAVP